MEDCGLPGDDRLAGQGLYDFLDQQAKTLGAAALLLRDQGSSVLLVRPRYRDCWQLPGGLPEADESPRVAAQREVREEIGLTVAAGRLLCVDYESVRPEAARVVEQGGPASRLHQAFWALDHGATVYLEDGQPV